MPRILAFVDQCQKSDAYAFFLNNNDIPALSLNSKRGQRVREQTLEVFRRNQISVVVRVSKTLTYILIFRLQLTSVHVDWKSRI